MANPEMYIAERVISEREMPYAPPKEYFYEDINRSIAKQLTEYFGKGMFSFKVDYEERKDWDDMRGGPVQIIRGKLHVAAVEIQRLPIRMVQPYENYTAARLVRTAAQEIRNRVRGYLRRWGNDAVAAGSALQTRGTKIGNGILQWIEINSPF